MADEFFIIPDTRTVTATGQAPTVKVSGTLTATVALKKLGASGAVYGGSALTAAITLRPIGASGATQNIELKPIGATGTIVAGNIVSASVKLPKVGLNSSVLSGNITSADIDLPAIGAAGDTGIAASISLPKFVTSGFIDEGNVLKVSVALPKIGMSSTVVGDSILAGAVSLRPVSLTTNILSGSAMAAAVSLKRLALAASGYTGSVVSAEISIPALNMDGNAYGEHTLEATITIPMLQLVATMADTDTSAVTVFAMNAKNAALTNYDGLAFNSAVRFNGVDLVANESGIFAITGDLDDGVIIDAYATLAATNFGTMQHKRVQSVYLGYRADGEMRLKVTVDEHHEFEYQVQPRNYDDIHGNRVKLGKGAKGTYWQIEVGNVDGAGFELDNIQPVVVPLARKV